MPKDWPFADPENVVAFTLKRIVWSESPILRVCHDEEDGGWQFLDGGEVTMEEAALVCLRNMVGLDPSLLELADLPYGWEATRSSQGQPWQRSPSVTDEDRKRKLVSDIEEFGWHVIMVPEDDEGPAFAYSIGLFETFSHPEIIIFGLDLNVMHQIVNLIGEEIKGGRRFAVGDAASGIIEAFDLRFANIAKRHFPEYLGYGSRYYEDSDFPVLQCIWPDKQGHFPTDSDFPESLRLRQPLLIS